MQPESSSTKNARIARNTALLYIRTLFTMLVSLYTSRIILEALGVDNYGVYNVVGGFVAMFAIVTGPITNAISRFLTFGLGKGDIDSLRVTFSTSINIQLGLGLIVILLGESVGIWFLNNKLNIPPDSMTGAHWALQCSIIASVLSLINTPYSAAIIAHEKMGVFAFMSILDVMLKLGLVLSLVKLPFDTLITYSVGLVAVYLIQRLIYGIYCTRRFTECRYRPVFDRNTFREMTSFAWWTFLGNTACVFNNQGVAMIMNIFFGVVVNTAKGIASQIETAVLSFVTSFTTAFTPQITKSYAEGNIEYMHSVMCRGSKFSIYLLMLFLIPLEFEAPTVLRFWLGEIPPYSAQFLRLSLLCTAVLQFGAPFYQGIMATGNIRNYQIIITIVGCLVFPLTWIAYKLGAEPAVSYWIFLCIYNILVWIRMWYVRKLLNLPLRTFTQQVFLPILKCGILSVIPAIIVCRLMPETTLRLCVTTGVTLITTSLIILYVGMTQGERSFILSKIRSGLHK